MKRSLDSQLVGSRTSCIAALVAIALAGAACSKKEEPAPAPAASSAPAPAPAGATASVDDWSWASAPATPPASTPAAPAPPPRQAQLPPASEEPPPTRIEPPPPAPKPRREESKPTNRLSRSDSPPRAEAPREPEPVLVTYTAQAGSNATFRFDNDISSESATVGQRVAGTLAADVTDGQGHVVLPAGTRLVGTVTEVVSAKKVKKKSALAFTLTEAQLPDGKSVPISIGERTEGKGWTKKDGAIIGGSAAGGAVLGQVLGHDTKSTAAGAVIGGAIASGVMMSKKGEDVVITGGQDITLPLERPVSVERREAVSRLRSSG